MQTQVQPSVIGVQEQPKVESKKKISLNEIDFDELSLDELRCIYNEIEQILLMDNLFSIRREQLKNKLAKEKEKLKIKMEKEIRAHRNKILDDLETIDKYNESDESQSSYEDIETEEIESIVYDKKHPKGQVRKQTVKKSTKKVPPKKTSSKKK